MALTAKKVYAILKRQISDMEAKLNSPVRYRGTVATADLLPLNPDIGDMYNIESKSIYGEAGMNVAWNGVVWDTMGAPIDMSLYLTKEEAESVIQRLVTEYFEKNPVKPGATTEQAQQIEQNKTDIASLKVKTGSLKEDLANKTMIQKATSFVNNATSFSDLSEVGIYQIFQSDISSYADRPCDTSGVLIVFSNGYTCQMYLALDGNVYVRAYNGVRWLDWFKVQSEINLSQYVSNATFTNFKTNQEIFNSSVNDSISVKESNPDIFIPYKGLNFVNGTEFDASYRRHTDYIDSNTDYIGISCDGEYKIALVAYDMSDAYIGAWNGSTFVTSSQDGTDEVWHNSLRLKHLITGYPNYKFKLNVKKGNNQSIYENPQVFFLKPLSVKENEDVQRLINEISSKTINQWFGRKWSAYGDSISTYSMISHGWGRVVNDILGFNDCFMRGIGGSSFAWRDGGGTVTFLNADGSYNSRNNDYTYDNYTGDIPSGCSKVRASFCSWSRITSMYPESIKNDIDMVFVMGGTNDKPNENNPTWVENSDVDSEWKSSSYYATYGGDFDISTIQGGVASTIMKLQAWMPNAIIVIGTPINGRTDNTGHIAPSKLPDEFVKGQQIKNAANIYGCPVIDMFASCKINVLNSNLYIEDGVHPNQSGCKLIGLAVTGGLIGIYPIQLVH